MQASKKATQRLRSGFHLSAPSKDDGGPKRKDRTGFIFALLGITLAIAIFLLA
jgi:hypothetical protein